MSISVTQDLSLSLSLDDHRPRLEDMEGRVTVGVGPKQFILDA